MTVRGEPLFATQHVHVGRAVVEDGRWARLWGLDRGGALSVVPVLWLLARGQGDIGATVRSTTLAEFAGLSRRGFRTALQSIDASELIQLLPTRKPDLTSFRIAPRVTTTSPNRGFYFPGSLVADGAWASLTAGERCVLVALAAAARRIEWPDRYAFADEPERFREWLNSYGAVDAFGVAICPAEYPYVELIADCEDYTLEGLGEEPEGTYMMVAVRRVARISCERLATLTGMHASSVTRAVDRLVNRNQPLLAVFNTPAQRLYLLPPATWGDVATRENQATYQQPLAPRWVEEGE